MEKIKSRLFVGLLFLLIGNNSMAQSSISDSLMHVIATAKEDSTKIDAVNDIPFGFYEPDVVRISCHCCIDSSISSPVGKMGY